MNTEYVLRPDGAILRRNIDEKELVLPASLADALCDKITLRMSKFLVINKMPCGAAMTKNGIAYVTIPLPVLYLRAPYKLVNGLLVPVFTSTTDPVMTMEWPKPADMALYLLAECCVGESGRMTTRTTWLFAMDSRKNTWRLPLGNVFEDCKVCLGEGNMGQGNTVQEACELLVETFHRSQYNADLWKTVEQTQSLFRFKPEASKFIPVSSDSHWTNYCQKVAVASSEYTTL